MARVFLQRGLMAAAAAFAVMVLAAAYVWRADIHQAFLDPGTPFQTYKPPPAPDYAKPASWALIPAKPATWAMSDPAADVFFVHPTTYDGGREWLGPILKDKPAKLLTRTMLPNYAGPFRKVARVFAPRYRQASLYTLLTSREDAREARIFAERDVEAAFRFYLQHYNRGRPLIIAGVEQGGFLASKLAGEAATDPAIAKRLVAVYLVETAISNDAPPLAACTAARQPGCLLAWMSVGDGEQRATDERLRHSLTWTGERADMFDGKTPLCVNPITGVRDSSAPAREHRGGVNASKLEWGLQPAYLAHQVSASCVAGLLHVSPARSPSLRPSGSWIERARARPYNTFYADIEADAQARTTAFLALPGNGKLAPPIDVVTEIGPRPVAR